MPQADTVALPKRFPLVLEPENRNESTDKDAKLVNGYVEKGGQGEYWIYKRPGLFQYSAVTAAAGSGVYNWLGDIYAIFGATLYKNGASIGTVDATGGVYRFDSSLGATPRLQLGNGVKAYNWDGTTLTQIAGPNFPGNTYASTGVKGWAYLDGTTYCLDTKAYIHGSDTVAGMNAPDQWTDTSNLLGAQIEPDAGIFLAKQLVYVLAFKQWSTEVFYDAQNPVGALPLAPVQGAKINYGCVNGDSVQEIDGAVLWLATNRSSATQVVMLDNLKATVVSTKAIERLLGDADFTTVYSFGLKFEGHRFYVVTVKNSNLTLVYDLADKMWAQWTDENGNYFKIVASSFLPGTGRVLQHESNGKLYKMDSIYLDDDGALITVELVTPNFDGGTRRMKQLNLLDFIGDRVEGSSLQVRVNDADYRADSWSGIRTVDLSAERPFLENCGSFRRRALHIQHKSATRLRIQALEMQLDLGVL